MEFLLLNPFPLPRRIALKSLNSPSATAIPSTDQKRKSASVANDGKENKNVCPVPDVAVMVEPSLAEELGVVRRRVARLRAEKERTEEMLRSMDSMMERKVRETETRWKEQSELEAEVRQLVGLKDLHLGLDLLIQQPSPYQSLRERERERRNGEAQTATTQEIKCESTESNRKESIEGQRDIEKIEGIERQVTQSLNKREITAQSSTEMKERKKLSSN